MTDPTSVQVELTPMAEIPPMTLQFTEAGVVQVAAMIAYLQYANEGLLQSLTSVQAVSTEQVERIRLLEREVAALTKTNTRLGRNDAEW